MTKTGFVCREVPYEGEVGAGRLLPFVPKEGSITVPVPDFIPESEPLGTMTVCGQSLERVGIHHGDVVLVRKIFSRRQIKRHTICVLYLRTLGEIVAKKVTFEKDFVVLHYCGLAPEPPMYLPASDVEIRGIVISRSQHRLEWPFIDEPTVQNGNGSGLSATERGAKLQELIERFQRPIDDELPF